MDLLRRIALLVTLFALMCQMAPSASQADRAIVAVATNFAPVARRLIAAGGFIGRGELVLVTGSTGRLYAQILNGAPFDVFLAADRERPRRLVENGLAIASSQYTYARGRLVLWSAKNLEGAEILSKLKEQRFRKLAIANPDLAPYGAATKDALKGLGLWSALTHKLVRAHNVGQAFAMARTGNAELGFVARSLIYEAGDTAMGRKSGEAGTSGGGFWLVPQSLHRPIRQDSVLLRRARNNRVAREFVAYLKSRKARALIAKFGYASGTAGD